MNIHAKYKLPNVYQSHVIGPDSLFCSKKCKSLKAYYDLDLYLTMPIIKLV